ncbi:hypothetical protein B296_00039409 [Ensete ventricosum]|uniref:Uncharacterized protein n=1 Tax=Ensete ventricosum TaxID=4639 RepID=A0A426X715_ENSVE|nr:hypothetical protein B296_00039409 [Ensete ventricosum]
MLPSLLTIAQPRRQCTQQPASPTTALAGPRCPLLLPHRVVEASSRRSSLSFLGHAHPPLATIVSATQPLPPLLYSSRSQPLPSPHLPSSSLR